MSDLESVVAELAQKQDELMSQIEAEKAKKAKAIEEAKQNELIAAERKAKETAIKEAAELKALLEEQKQGKTKPVGEVKPVNRTFNEAINDPNVTIAELERLADKITPNDVLTALSNIADRDGSVKIPLLNNNYVSPMDKPLNQLNK